MITTKMRLEALAVERMNLGWTLIVQVGQSRGNLHCIRSTLFARFGSHFSSTEFV